MPDVPSGSSGVKAPPIRSDTPMQEPISIDVSRVHGNGTGHSHGIPSASPDPPSAGFTAVNGTKQRSASFRKEASANFTTAPSENGSKLPSPGYMQYHTHGWRPATDYSPAPNEPQHRDSPVTGKRKWGEQQSGSPDGEGAEMPGYRVERMPSPNRRLTTLDSAVDLTSPDNPNQPAPLERNDSDSSEGAQRTYRRENSPVERWNKGEPPPKPRPEIEASLAASLHQFQQQNQQVQEHQSARPTSPDRYSPPDEEDDTGEPQAGSDDQYHGDNADNKRRKRNFSNRTKTGCHTCRQRKKKCDEGKPTCQNCERGNFVCTGYGTKPPGGSKPTQSRTIIPLQSKAPMAPYNNRSMIDAPIRAEIRAEEGRSYSHWGRIPPPEPDPPRQYIPVAPADPRRPSTAENWQKSAYTPPEPVHPYQVDRPPLPPNFTQAPPPPPPVQPPYNPDHRPHSHLPQYPPPQQPQLHPPQHHPTHQQPLPSTQTRHPAAQPPPPPMTLEPWGPHVGLAPYQHQNGPSSQMSSRDSVHSSSHLSSSFYNTGPSQQEKDNMLRGKPFMHYLDSLLLSDREACRASVEAYNKAAEMNSGESRHRRSELFTRILKPDKRPINKKMGEHYRHFGPVGTVGDHTIVESPFDCEYGYNIHIGKDCVIERGVYFQDAADIFIGDRVMIGHNVRLYCITAGLEPEARQGARSKVHAGAIKIHEECFIGANTIIMPFVTIGKGATVGAGSVVTKDVEENTVVVGNPAKLVRRIEGSNVSRHHSQQIQRQQENMQAWMTNYANKNFSFYSSPRINR